MLSFIEIRFVDVVDIVLSAYIMYMLYKLIKGTMAASIIMSILAFLALWIVVRALNMSMLSAVMGSFVNIGLLALIVIFQQEIRTFLAMISTKHSFLKRFGLDKLDVQADELAASPFVSAIVKSCESMSASHTGALIVVAREVGLKDYVATGNEINAQFSQQLIETVFFKNTPLHDGAMIVDKKRIIAAGCILPVSQSMDIPKNHGLRHRSALGITELTDAVSVVVSEETGAISIFDHGKHHPIGSAIELGEYLEKI